MSVAEAVNRLFWIKTILSWSYSYNHQRKSYLVLRDVQGSCEVELQLNYSTPKGAILPPFQLVDVR